jgi:hypothetical protein
MLQNKTNINELNLKVNDLGNANINLFEENQRHMLQDFEHFVNSEKERDSEIEKALITEKAILKKIESDRKQKQQTKYKPYNYFFKLVPELHLSYIYNIIKVQFGNDIKAYIESAPLFSKHFTRRHKLICDSVISCDNKRDKRRLNKQKKELLLFSAQLLGLVGKARAKILNESLVKNYLDEMAKAEEFIEKFRIIHKSGKIMRLVSLEKKLKQKQAQIIKLSKCMSLRAKDKGYTYTLLTLTLPPIFHPRPSLGENSFEAILPSESHDKLMNFWKLIRSNLAFNGLHAGNGSIFGLEILECHGDSCLHLHALIYHSDDNTGTIHRVIRDVQNRHNAQFPIDSSMSFGQKRHALKRRVKFDIKLNDGRASGSTYVFKYITKTTGSYNNKDAAAVKNQACRYYYSARGFNFFGLKGSITKFNFLQANYHLYTEFMTDEILAMFKANNYYLFVSKYADMFKNEYYRDAKNNRKLLGVSFDLSKININEKRIVLIEKKQYCIFEKTEDFDDEKHIDANDSLSEEVKRAYKAVCKKQDYYDIKKDDYIKEQLLFKNEVVTVSLDGMQILSDMYKKKGLIAQITKAVCRHDDESHAKTVSKLSHRIGTLRKSSSIRDESDRKTLESLNLDFMSETEEERNFERDTVLNYGYTFEKIKKESRFLQLFNFIQERASITQFDEVLELLN